MAAPASKVFRRLGDPVLRTIATRFTPDEIRQAGTKQLLTRMWEALSTHGVGLAAPQIGVQRAVFVAKTESKSAARDAMPPTVFFNPRLEFPKKKAQLISNEQQVPIVMWEGCLSVPGMVGKVMRNNVVQISYLDEDGNPRKAEATGFLAGLIQHETDHLNGILYVDRLSSMKDLYFDSEFEAEYPNLAPQHPRGAFRIFDSTLPQ